MIGSVAILLKEVIVPATRDGRVDESTILDRVLVIGVLVSKERQSEAPKGGFHKHRMPVSHNVGVSGSVTGRREQAHKERHRYQYYHQSFHRMLLSAVRCMIRAGAPKGPEPLRTARTAPSMPLGELLLQVVHTALELDETPVEVLVELNQLPHRKPPAATVAGARLRCAGLAGGWVRVAIANARLRGGHRVHSLWSGAREAATSPGPLAYLTPLFYNLCTIYAIFKHNKL
jgi:hypothetical protein